MAIMDMAKDYSHPDDVSNLLFKVTSKEGQKKMKQDKTVDEIFKNKPADVEKVKSM